MKEFLHHTKNSELILLHLHPSKLIMAGKRKVIYHVFQNVVMGVAGGALVCFAKLSPRRQEALLYISCTVLAVNMSAAILREWGLYFQNLNDLLKDHPHHLVILYSELIFYSSFFIAEVVIYFDSSLYFRLWNSTECNDNIFHCI